MAPVPAPKHLQISNPESWVDRSQSETVKAALLHDMTVDQIEPDHMTVMLNTAGVSMIEMRQHMSVRCAVGPIIA